MERALICGGGVIGAAVAYSLSQHGVSSTVLESRRIASGASGSAAGLLSPPSPADARQPAGQLASLSIGLHFELAEQIGGADRYAFEPLDMALVARDEQEAQLIQRAFGNQHWLEGPALRNACPWIDREVVGGVIREGGAQLDPARFTRTLLEEAGAEVVSARANGLHTKGGRVTGLRTSDGELEGDCVVLAMGPWTRDAASWLGVPVPVRPLKGEVLRLHLDGAPAGGFSDLDGNYLVRKPDGVVYTGTTEEEAGFDELPTASARIHILAQAARISSRVGEGAIIDQTACLRPLSADAVPIIGPAPGLEGVYLATGHGRKGIMLSLATGKALAEHIVTGHPSIIDLGPFSPGRFVSTRAER